MGFWFKKKPAEPKKRGIYPNVLLFGINEVGKTTILKQFRNIYSPKTTILKEYSSSVHNGIFDMFGKLYLVLKAKYPHGVISKNYVYEKE